MQKDLINILANFPALFSGSSTISSCCDFRNWSLVGRFLVQYHKSNFYWLSIHYLRFQTSQGGWLKSTYRLGHFSPMKYPYSLFSNFGGVSDRLFLHSEILKRGCFPKSPSTIGLWRGNLTLFAVMMVVWRDFASKVASNRVIGWNPHNCPHVVAEPICSFW